MSLRPVTIRRRARSRTARSVGVGAPPSPLLMTSGATSEATIGRDMRRRRPRRRRGRAAADARAGGLSTSPSMARRWRRRRRKWPYHHDTRIRTAPPVTTWPRPDRALTRAVMTTGPCTGLAAGRRDDLDDDRRGAVRLRLDRDQHLGGAVGAEHDRDVAFGEAQLRRARTDHDAQVLGTVVADVQPQRRAASGEGERERVEARPPPRTGRGPRRRCGPARRRRRRRRPRSRASASSRPIQVVSCVPSASIEAAPVADNRVTLTRWTRPVRSGPATAGRRTDSRPRPGTSITVVAAGTPDRWVSPKSGVSAR